MSKQVLVAESIIRMIKARNTFDEIVAKFLPEYIDQNGNCVLEIKTRKDLKSNYQWSGKFDETIYIPFLHRDWLFTILYELDKKQYPDIVGPKTYHAKRLFDPDEVHYWEIKVAAFNNFIEFVNQSNLGEHAKVRMINELKKSLKV